MVYVHQVIPAIVLCFLGFMFTSVETTGNMMGVEQTEDSSILLQGFIYMGFALMISGIGYLAICMYRTRNDPINDPKVETSE